MQPTAGRKTQNYGTYPQASGEPWGHTGNDYAGTIGADVVAIADGEVIFADWGQNMPKWLADKYAFVYGSPNSGIKVLIQHKGWVSVSAHLNDTPLNPGNKVRRGQRIGSLGATGRVQGAHLHFECINRTHVYTAPFGRFHPDAQIAHEDAVSDGARLLTVTADPATVRTSPRVEARNTATAFPSGIAKGSKVAAIGYVTGQDPFPNDGVQDDAWVKTVSGYYIWANSLGNDLSGLRRL